MKPLRAIIIEDEPNGREYLYSMCKEIGSHTVEVVAMASNAQDGISCIKKYSPDLIFLDIKMPEHNGFEMLSSIQNIDFDIIFTTAHSEYAIQAFDYSAISYLLKPLDEDRLLGALLKAQNSKENKQIHERVKLLEQKLKNDKPDRVCINIGGKYEIFYLDKLSYLEADGNYSIIKYDGKNIITARTLKKFESILPEASFSRISRSVLVNTDHVQSIITKDGDKYISMKDGEELLISPNKLKEVVSKI